MTIKKRLFISNILMVVIPVIIALITFIFCVFVLNILLDGKLYEIIEQSEKIPKQHFRRYPDLKEQILILAGAVIVAVTAAILIINKLLTRFIFNKIEQPLKILSGGVRQISEGNLDYNIKYNVQDEFKPVCDDFNEMAKKLKASIEEVQKNERSRKELLANISHDIRSPLTSIKAYVEGLMDGVASTPEMRQEYLKTIKNKTDSINKMVSKIFLFSKIDLGNYPYCPEKLNLKTEIMDRINASRDECRDRGLIFDILSIEENLYIYVDPSQLHSIFINIIDNSIKYKNKEFVYFSVYGNLRNETVHLILEDDGSGVPDDMLSKIFEVFYRIDPSRSNPQEGSGLGLAIAAKAVEQMKGKTYAENRAEGGLRIVIDIPVWRESIDTERNEQK